MTNRRIAEMVLESAIDYAIITADLSGNVTSWSTGAEKIFGWAEDEVLGLPADIIFTSADRAHNVPAKEIANALQNGRATDERWHVRKDGSRFWASGEMLRLHDDGAAEGFLKIVRDRTQQKRAEELQSMLSQELSHRLKNQLAMVQGIVNQSLRRADNIEAARLSISERLGVLGRAHDLLLTGYGERIEVRTLIERAVNLDQNGRSSQFNLKGPELQVGPQSALSLAMLLHELTTNAFKYGALSTAEGQVSVEWGIADMNKEPAFKLNWREKNGPPVVKPTVEGMGTRLVKSGVAGTPNQVDLEYAPEGLRCTVLAQLEGFQADP
ncbi:PAS domain S-box-containing protein [Phyllobacterium sp. 1468]|uniref:sensor histidine kinase n=1 Tax=Phyllobacterium sp. 1468 TaxID=2817759 RepID=UPI001AE142F4|nr:PAS domain S-box protein [Phyllobacterium sp. 1468]MDR6636207.1 PAS domain S-box-containing protein [Phyllobacterium sp. 1468]